MREGGWLILTKHAAHLSWKRRKGTRREEEKKQRSGSRSDRDSGLVLKY
jgi:hypothetical protein